MQNVVRWRKLILLSLLIASFLPRITLGARDSVLSGQILSLDDREPVVDAVCQLIARDGRPLGYTFSSASGVFKVKWTDQAQLLKISHLRYEAKLLSLDSLNKIKGLQIWLKPNLRKIPEVRVTAAPIRQRGDTIKYNVASFKTENDRYVADILKKLPGVDVKESGQITYQGEAITHLYVEGRDLMGGQYGLISNNLDVNAISSVEVLERNQHVKVLRGVELSDRAAINLRLNRSHTMRPFGEVTLGAGIWPLLYSGRMVTSFLSSGFQAMVTAKGGNTGSRILTELKSLTLSPNGGGQGTSPLMASPEPRGVPLPRARHLFNSTYLTSANTLVPLTKNSELKINISHGQDWSSQDFFLLQELGTGAAPLRLVDQTDVKKHENTNELGISYELNGDKSYILNKINYQYAKLGNESDQTGSQILNVTGGKGTQKLNNNFKSIFRIKKESTLHFNSLLNFEKKDEHLKNTPEEGTESSAFSQDYLQESIFTRNLLKASVPLWGNLLGLGLWMEYHRQVYNGAIDLGAGNEAMRDLKSFSSRPHQAISKMEGGIEGQYGITIGEVYLGLQLPLTYSTFHTSIAEDNRKNFNFLTISPSLNFSYKLNRHWSMRARLSHDANVRGGQSLLYQPYFSSHRYVTLPLGTVDKNKHHSIMAGVNYKDVLRLLFFNFKVVYSTSLPSYEYRVRYGEPWTYISQEANQDLGHNIMATGSISKSIPSWGLILSLEPLYTWLMSRSRQQELTFDYKANSLALPLTTNFQKWDWLTLSYTATATLRWEHNSITKSTIQSGFSNAITLMVSPLKGLRGSITAYHTAIPRMQNQHQNFFFLDAGLRYNYKRFEFSLTARNLAGIKSFDTETYTGINHFSQQIPLRGLEALLSISFKF